MKNLSRWRRAPGDEVGSIRMRRTDRSARCAIGARWRRSLDASGTEALTAWATSGEGAAPTPNAEARVALVADLSTAQASAGAAEKAYAGVAATYTAVTARTKAHDDEITAATVGVLAEELAPLAKKAVEAARDFAMARDVVIEGGALAPAASPRGLPADLARSAPSLWPRRRLSIRRLRIPTADFASLTAVKAAWAKFADGLAAGDDGLYFGVE